MMTASTGWLVELIKSNRGAWSECFNAWVVVAGLPWHAQC